MRRARPQANQDGSQGVPRPPEGTTAGHWVSEPEATKYSRHHAPDGHWRTHDLPRAASGRGRSALGAHSPRGRMRALKTGRALAPAELCLLQAQLTLWPCPLPCSHSAGVVGRSRPTEGSRPRLAKRWPKSGLPEAELGAPGRSERMRARARTQEAVPRSLAAPGAAGAPASGRPSQAAAPGQAPALI
ncbi:hypothetical protein R6Z07F_019765 [Ovis aries]